MYIIWILFLAFFNGCGTAFGEACPDSKGPMVRVGRSKYFIFHKPKDRSYHHNFLESKKLCEKYNMKMAKIRDLATFHYLGRHLEEWVHATSAQDTWYWLDAKFDHGKEAYFWGDGTTDPLKFTNFFYRYPRPSGVASQVDWMDVYKKNSTVEQCLAFALPLPRSATGRKGAIVHGFSTTFDEKPCVGRKKRHAICESSMSDCQSEIQDPFYLTENENQYFEDGHWIIGERKFIVSWKQRSRDESKVYCSKLGLTMYSPSDNDSSIIPHLKLWSRNVNMSQFWTSWTYKVENGDGVFTDSTGKTVAHLKSNIQYASPTGRSNKNSMKFCVASQFYYEFRDQLRCADTDNACSWSGTSRVPTNCNNYIGTICQHADHTKRLVEWNTEYIRSPDFLINDGMKSTIEFGWEGNTFALRSRFKQTFGSLVCPPGHKMLRKDNTDWSTPKNDAVLYRYDFQDTYWVVDEDGFKKDTNSLCAVSKPKSEDGLLRNVEKVPCTEWHFYICVQVNGALKTPDGQPPYNTPKSPGWNAKRHSREYPIVVPPSPESECEISQNTKIQMVFVMDRTGTFGPFFEKFTGIATAITSKLNKVYPGSEYGIVYFADYHIAAKPLPRAEATDADCYFLHQKLTPDVNFFLTKTSKPESIQSGLSEASMLAVMYAAVDKNVGWSLADASVQKILVLVTDQDYSNDLLNKSTRTPALGDGTDSCEKNLPPQLDLIGKVLRQRSMSLIGLFPDVKVDTVLPGYKRGKQMGDLARNVYERHFSKLNVPFNTFTYELGQTDLIAEHIVQGVKIT